MTTMTAPPAETAMTPTMAGAQSLTDPNSSTGGVASVPAATAAMVPAVQTGVATRYWDELVSYPTGSTASLWLYVDGTWRAHDNPTPSVRDAVQRAFIAAGQTVRVWYDGGRIHGLVVND